MSYPPPPPTGPGSSFPPPPGGWQSGGQPPGYPPLQGYPAPGYPARDPYQQPPPERRRSGCRGCFFGCLIAFFVGIAALAVVFVAGVYLVKSMFPSDLSFGDAAGCAVMRVVVENADTVIEGMEGSAAEKAEMRSAVRELRAEYERQCGTQRMY